MTWEMVLSIFEEFMKDWYSFFFKDFIYLFLERGEREREKHQCVVLLACPPHLSPGTWPTTQACALTGN